MFTFSFTRHKKKVLLFFFAVLLIASACSSPAAGEEELEWATLITGVSGNDTTTTDAYGYYTDVKGFGEVFVICDPDTGKETGYAYVPGVKVGEKTSQIITGYTPGGKTEDWSISKRIDPVQIKIIAPNVPSNLSYTDYSWEYAEETGKYIQTAHNQVQWPGSTKGYLLPGTDPNYWLMIAQVTNPNPWPVKTQAYGYVDEFRESTSKYADAYSPTLDKEISLQANETKYILVNKGKPFPKAFLRDDYEWHDGNPDRLESWSEAYYRSTVSENLDPEYPDYLKPNRGFSQITYYVGGGYSENDLTNSSLIVSYSVDCREATSKPKWYFEGSISRRESGWVVSPSSNGYNVNTPAATTALVNFFTNHWPEDVPSNLDNDDSAITIDNIRFDECKIGQLTLDAGPASYWYDLAGPAIADPASYELELNGGYEKIFSTEEDYGTIGWMDSLPCLCYDPVFIEMYEFVPTEGTDIGALVKNVVPGYCVWASSIDKPEIEITSSAVGTPTVEMYSWKQGKTTYYRYDTYFTIHAKITANNPEDATITFSNITGIANPFPMDAARVMEGCLYDWYKRAAGDDLACLYPELRARVNYRDSTEERQKIINNFVSQSVLYPVSSITLTPRQNKVIYEGDMTFRVSFPTEFEYEKSDKTRTQEVSSGDILLAASNALSCIDKTNEEAFFITSGSNPVFSINTSGTDILTLNQATGKYSYKNKDHEKRYDFETFGCATDNPYLRPLSYFNSSFSDTDGVCTRATDELWKNLGRVMSISGTDQDGLYDFGDFWPTMYLDSEKVSDYTWEYFWRQSLDYEDD